MNGPSFVAAFAFNRVDESTGRWVPGSRLRKSKMLWPLASTPVAKVDQPTGDMAGQVVARGRKPPFFFRRARWGSWPSSIIFRAMTGIQAVEAQHDHPAGPGVRRRPRPRSERITTRTGHRSGQKRQQDARQREQERAAEGESGAGADVGGHDNQGGKYGNGGRHGVFRRLLVGQVMSNMLFQADLNVIKAPDMGNPIPVPRFPN